MGGSIWIEYETYRLRDEESFLIFIDGEEMLKVTKDVEADDAGFSVQKKDSCRFQLSHGDHVI